MLTFQGRQIPETLAEIVHPDHTVVMVHDMQIRDGQAETSAELVAGRPYYRAAGARHDVVNANAFEFVFVEVELKAPPG